MKLKTSKIFEDHPNNLKFSGIGEELIEYAIKSRINQSLEAIWRLEKSLRLEKYMVLGAWFKFSLLVGIEWYWMDFLKDSNFKVDLQWKERRNKGGSFVWDDMQTCLQSFKELESAMVNSARIPSCEPAQPTTDSLRTRGNFQRGHKKVSSGWKLVPMSGITQTVQYREVWPMFGTRRSKSSWIILFLGK